MATHPLVLLVEPDPMLRELIHGELADEGCIVVDAASGDDALSFAKLYPGPIDLAVTDLARPEHNTRFAHALRSLPTGRRAKISWLADAFDRAELIESVRQAVPTGKDKPMNMNPMRINAQTEEGERAVFWGALHHDGSATGLRPAVNS
jgi:CheY-like chemotaxis protein